MSKFNFDDTETSGIWWSTNVSIRDLCIELKEDTSCDDNDNCNNDSFCCKTIIWRMQQFLFMIGLRFSNEFWYINQ